MPLLTVLPVSYVSQGHPHTDRRTRAISPEFLTRDGCLHLENTPPGARSPNTQTFLILGLIVYSADTGSLLYPRNDAFVYLK